MTDLTAAVPEIFLAVCACFLLLFGTVRRLDAFVWTSRLSALALLGALVLVCLQDHVLGAFDGLYISDPFGRFAKTLILGAGSAAVLMAVPYLQKIRTARAEYPALILFSALGMMLMASAADLTVLYVGLEMQSLALYILVTFRRDHISGSEAGLKYFVLGALSSGMLLYGLSLLYGFAGGTRFSLLAAALDGKAHLPLGAYFGFGFVLAGLAFKLSLVPFHMWTPDVYEKAPTSVSFFLASAAKVAAVALFVRVFVQIFGGIESAWQQVLLVLAVASMFLGAIGGLVQTRLKRLLAYSAITNMGTALVGLIAYGPDGVGALLIYVALYTLATLGAFGILHALRRDGQMVDGLADLAGLSESHPYFAALMAFFMFSLAGVPPLAGFFGKYFVFAAAVQKGLWALALAGVLASVLAAGYYLRVVKALYFDERTDDVLDQVPEWSLRLLTTGAAVAIACLVVFPGWLTDKAALAAQGLWGG